jgi:rhodanese-related sulfurtransferase
MTAPTISTEGLRELLERGSPVTVLDVRPAAERAEWSIPGSVHADAYEALRRRDPNALADFHPTNGGRVVTVCAAGKTSVLAAERLRGRGLDAVSLEGGMRAWSLAWNTAEPRCPGSIARIVQVRRTGKGCLSYLIASNGDAVVIDASLDPEVYRRLAEEHGWRIRTVLETHVHADHLSRARALAVDTGARLCLPTTDRVSFDFAPLKDGDTLRVGSAGLRVLHTPAGQRADSYNASLCRATVRFGSSRNPANSHWNVDEAAPSSARDRSIMDCLCAAPTRNAALLNEASRQWFSMFFIIALSRSSMVLSHRS